jgi:hypothetical protein
LVSREDTLRNAKKKEKEEINTLYPKMSTPRSPVVAQTQVTSGLTVGCGQAMTGVGQLSESPPFILFFSSSANDSDVIKLL